MCGTVHLAITIHHEEYEMGKYVPYEETEVLSGHGVPDLNNFLSHFRFLEKPKETSVCDEYFPDGMYRVFAKDEWDVTYRAQINEILRGASTESFDEYCAGRSDKCLNQTPRQFYAEFDGVVERLGISPDVIAKKINAYLMQRRSIPREESLRLNAKLNIFLLPIYIALREVGYNKKDLWS